MSTLKNNLLEIYVDGSANGDWGAFAIKIWQGSDCIFTHIQRVRATAPKCKMLAVAYVLHLFQEKPVNGVIYSDSQYTIDGYYQHIKLNKNIELWEKIHQLKHPTLQLMHVKGHADNERNNDVDKLARQEQRAYYKENH